MQQTLVHYARRAAEKWRRWRYLRTARGILSTPPLRQGHEEFAFLSMLHSRDLLSYLVAIKSICRFANPKRVILVCDPSLTEGDKAALRAHVPHIELLPAENFRHPDIPVGGTWERLHAIARLSADLYVVQLDADTLTVGDVEEVRDCIRQQAGFVLGEREGQTTVSLQETTELAREWLATHPPHVQDLAEVSIGQIGLDPGLRYVRGCSAFCGHPPSVERLPRMMDFSRRMRGSLDDQWDKWGTEQVASNFLVANSKGARCCRFPDTGCPWPSSPCPPSFISSASYDLPTANTRRTPGKPSLHCMRMR